MEWAIEAVRLSKEYPKRERFLDYLMPSRRKRSVAAFSRVNLQVRKGEVFGLIGPNGAGKTSIIKTLGTLVLPTCGEAWIEGRHILKNEMAVKKLVGLVINEERSFYWRLTGRQNLQFFAALHNLSKQAASRRIGEVLELLELQEVADTSFMKYSTGMRQKLSIARALLPFPRVLFMDEPTRSLDPAASKSLRRFIVEQLAGEKMHTVFVTSHNLEEISRMCDRIAIISRGKIRACGTLAELRKASPCAPRWALELDNFPQEVEAALKQMVHSGLVKEFQSERVNGVLQIRFDLQEGGEEIPRLLQAIVRAGGKILSCRREEPRLSEIFDHFTKGGGNP